MKTVGQILREARTKKGVSLQEISDNTRIRVEFLVALECDQHQELPSQTFVKGFLQLYAKELGLDPKSTLALFRRDFVQEEKTGELPRMFAHPLNAHRTQFQKQWKVLGAIVVVFLAVFGFAAIQWVQLSAKPALAILAPEDNQVVGRTVEVRGRTATDAIVFVNEKPVALDQNGEFSTTVQFDAGEHAVVIEAKNREGKSRLVQRTVRVVE